MGEAKPSRQVVFLTTHWSLIRRARNEQSEKSGEALNCLCEAYWYPLYAYSRQRGIPHNTAEDHVQSFFAQAIERNLFEKAVAGRGKFRTFLLACFNNFLKNEFKRANRKKRGGDQTILKLDFSEGERRFDREPSHNLTAERLYQRTWAQTLLQRCMTSLQERYAQRDQTELFDSLKAGLISANAEQTEAWAARFQRSPGSIRVFLTRMRTAYRELLRAEIANTLDFNDHTTDSERLIEAEIKVLFESL